MITKTVYRPTTVIDLDKIKVGTKVNVKTRTMANPSRPDLWHEDMDGEVMEVYEDNIVIKCNRYCYDFDVEDFADEIFCKITILE